MLYILLYYYSIKKQNKKKDLIYADSFNDIKIVFTLLIKLIVIYIQVFIA